jgi:hypothetical protein
MLDVQDRPRLPMPGRLPMPAGIALSCGEVQQLDRMALGIVEFEGLDAATHIARGRRLGAHHHADVLEPAVAAAGTCRKGPPRSGARPGIQNFTQLQPFAAQQQPRQLQPGPWQPDQKGVGLRRQFDGAALGPEAQFTGEEGGGRLDVGADEADALDQGEDAGLPHRIRWLQGDWAPRVLT